MPTAWLKVMLEEVARKRVAAAEQRAESERRRAVATGTAGEVAGGARAATRRGAATGRSRRGTAGRPRAGGRDST